MNGVCWERIIARGWEYVYVYERLDNVKNVWLPLCSCVKSCVAAVQMDLTARLLCASEAKGIK